MRRDVIAIGASAGGIAPLGQLLGRLPGDLPASLFVVVHRGVTPWPDTLPQVLQRFTELPVEAARDGARPEPRRVYVGPPDQHLRIVGDCIRTGEVLDARPARASIDALFRSAAAAYGGRVAAVVLSGALDDGTVGLWDVRRAGGVAIVQDPRVAEHPSMPQSAMREVPIHYCLTIPEIATTLAGLATGAVQVVHRPRVLIVEDERLLALQLERRLQDVGYDVVGSLATGEEAVRAAGELAPDVVVMDIQLAGPMRGTEAAVLLWERFRMPIVYLTSYSDEQTLREATTLPCGFIVKPFRTTQLHAAIQIALDRRAVCVRSAAMR